MAEPRPTFSSQSTVFRVPGGAGGTSGGFGDVNFVRQVVGNGYDAPKTDSEFGLGPFLTEQTPGALIADVGPDDTVFDFGIYNEGQFPYSQGGLTYEIWRVDDECVLVTGYDWIDWDHPITRVQRGVMGEKAAHSAGSLVTPYDNSLCGEVIDDVVYYKHVDDPGTYKVSWQASLFDGGAHRILQPLYWQLMLNHETEVDRFDYAGFPDDRWAWYGGEVMHAYVPDGYSARINGERSVELALSPGDELSIRAGGTPGEGGVLLETEYESIRVSAKISSGEGLWQGSGDHYFVPPENPFPIVDPKAGDTYLVWCSNEPTVSPDWPCTIEYAGCDTWKLVFTSSYSGTLLIMTDPVSAVIHKITGGSSSFILTQCG